MSILKVGLVQQSCDRNRDNNIAKSIAGIRVCAANGAQLVVLQELHTGIYFCQAEETDMFDLAETIPGPSTEAFSAIAKECNVVLVTSLFERRAAGIYHNTAVVFESNGSMANIERCTSLMTPLIMRNFISHREISVSNHCKQASANLASSFAGTNGTLKRLASWHLPERKY